MAGQPYIRIIGDVHGRIAAPPLRKERNVRDLFPHSPYRARGERKRSYLQLVEQAKYSVQIGDLGSDYGGLSNIDPAFHFVIAGNHDNLRNLTPHFLGDFGFHSISLPSGSFDFFFLRGAQSIDVDRRDEGVNWWPDEELTDDQMNVAFDQYNSLRPQVVISHDCPTEVIPLIATIALEKAPSRTNSLLQSCFEAHSPAMWIFGHHHRNWSLRHESGTIFVCVGELGYFDFDETGTPMFDVPR